MEHHAFTWKPDEDTKLTILGALAELISTEVVFSGVGVIALVLAALVFATPAGPPNGPPHGRERPCTHDARPPPCSPSPR